VVYIQFDSGSATGGEFDMFRSIVRKFRSGIGDATQNYNIVYFDNSQKKWFFNTNLLKHLIDETNAVSVWSALTTFREELDRFVRATRRLLIQNYDEVVREVEEVQRETLSVILGGEQIVATVEPETTSPLVPTEYRDLYASVVIRVSATHSEVLQRFVDELKRRISSRLTLSYRVYDVRVGGYSRYTYSFATVSYEEGVVRIDVLRGLVMTVVETLIRGGIRVVKKPIPQIKLGQLVVGDRVVPDKVYAEVRDYIEQLKRRIAATEGEVPLPSIEIRPYQVDAVAEALTWLYTSGRALVEIPTGGGKTMVAALVAYIMSKYNEDLKLLMTTLRSDIVRQFSDYLVERLAPLRDNLLVVSRVYGGKVRTECYRSGVEVQCPRGRPRVVPDIVVATSASLYYALLFVYYMMYEVKRRAREVYSELSRQSLDDIVRTASEKCAKLCVAGRCTKSRIVDEVRETASRGTIPMALLRRLSMCIAFYDFVNELYTRESATGRYVIKERPVSIRDINKMIKPKLMDMLLKVLYAPVVFNIDELRGQISKDVVDSIKSYIVGLIAKARRGNKSAERQLRTVISTALRLMLAEIYARIVGRAKIDASALRMIANDLSSIYSNYLDRAVQIDPDRSSVVGAIIDLIRSVRQLTDSVMADMMSHGLQHVAERFKIAGRKLDDYTLATAVVIRMQMGILLGNIVAPYRVRVSEEVEERPRETAVESQPETTAEEGRTVAVEPDDVIEIDDLPKVEKEELVFTRPAILLALRLLRLRRKRVLIIIDEAHHTPASSIALLLLFFKRALVLGLTATPYRGDKLDTLIYGLAGGVVYSISSSELIGRGYLVPAYIFNIVYHTKNNEPLNNVVSNLADALKSLRSALSQYRDLVPVYKKGARPSDTTVREMLLNVANQVANTVRQFFGKFNLAPVFDAVYKLARDERTLEAILRKSSIDDAVTYIQSNYGLLKNIELPDLLARECSKPEYRDHMQCICTSRPEVHRADLQSAVSELPDKLGEAVAKLIQKEYCSNYGTVKLITPEFFARLAVRVLMLYAVATLDVRPGVGEWTPMARVASFRRRLGGMIQSVEQAIASIYVRAINNDIVRNWILADAVMQTVHGMTKASGTYEYGKDGTTYPFAIVTPWREGADRMYSLMVARVAAHCYTYSYLYNVSADDLDVLLDMCLKTAKKLVYEVHGDVSTDKRKAIYDALRKRQILGIVATTVLNEGIDIPSLSILAIHRGGRGRVGTKQVVGRGLRPYSDGRYTKRALILIDVMDMENPSSIAANRCRMTFYCLDEPLWVKVQVSDEYLYDFKHAKHSNTGYYTIPSPKFYYMPQTGVVDSFFELVGYSAYNHKIPAVEVEPNRAMYIPAFLETARRAYGYRFTSAVPTYLRRPIFDKLARCLDINSCITAFMQSYREVKKELQIGKTAESIVRECMSSLGKIDVVVTRVEEENGKRYSVMYYDKFSNVVRYDYSTSRYVVEEEGQRLNLARRVAACLAFNWAYSASNCRVFADGGPVRDLLTAYLCLTRELYVVDADSLSVDSAVYAAHRRYEYCRREGCEDPPEHEALGIVRAVSPVCVMNLLYRIRSIMNGPYKDEFKHLLSLYGRMHGVKVEEPEEPTEGEDYLAKVLVRDLGEHFHAYIYALKELC